MNEQTVQLIISNLGETIAQLHVNFAIEKANVKQLSEELELAKQELELTKQELINLKQTITEKEEMNYE